MRWAVLASARSRTSPTGRLSVARSTIAGILSSQSRVTSTMKYAAGRPFDRRASSEARTTAAEGLREAVFAGPGVCLASEWMFLPDLDNGRAKQVLPVWAL